MSDDEFGIEETEQPEGTSKPPAEGKDPGKKPPGKGGFWSRMGERLPKVQVPGVRADFVNWKTIGLGLVALLILWLLLANLSPVRVVLWFWTVDVPKALAFLIDVALGALLMWLWMRHRSRAAAVPADKEGEQ